MLMAGSVYAVRAALAPLPGEWSVPLKLGPLDVRAGVPSLIRLATSRWGGPLLDGRRIPSRAGAVHLSWRDDQLLMRCAPCELQLPGLGGQALRLPELNATMKRQAETLSGEFASGKVRGTWQGELTREGLRLRLAIPDTPIADVYTLFAAEIPELAHAHIEGRFSLQAQLALPTGALRLVPRVTGFQVAGLGTGVLAAARSSCTRQSSRLTPDSWLARAVVAAEDQRFFEHPGYDLAELAASFNRNHQQRRIERGASTLSQQVAKLLVTGDERSPARKLRELLYAVEMERTLGKARLLRLYLDNAPWGAGQCGAEAAARHYFKVMRADRLTPAQAAWLAAMLHSPTAEAQRWAETGHINLARAQWVALGMRGLGAQKKLALAQEMAGLDWHPRWAERTTAAAGSLPVVYF